MVTFISNGLTIIGDEYANQLMKNKVKDKYGDVHLKDYYLDLNDKDLNAVYVLFMFTDKSQFSSEFIEMYPELNVVREDKPVYIVKNGRRLAFIKSKDLEKSIAELDGDFLIDSKYQDRNLIDESKAYLEGDLKESDLLTHIKGINVTGKSAYFYDSGKDSDDFFRIVNRADIKSGFINNYLIQYETHKNEVDMLLISSLTDFNKLPIEIRDQLSETDYKDKSKYFYLEFENSANVLLFND